MEFYQTPFCTHLLHLGGFELQEWCCVLEASSSFRNDSTLFVLHLFYQAKGLDSVIPTKESARGRNKKDVRGLHGTAFRLRRKNELSEPVQCSITHGRLETPGPVRFTGHIIFSWNGCVMRYFVSSDASRCPEGMYKSTKKAGEQEAAVDWHHVGLTEASL